MTEIEKKLKGIDMIEGIGISSGGHLHKGRILRSFPIEGWDNFPNDEHFLNHFFFCNIQISKGSNAASLGE
jgi:hypothetical protein